MTIRSHHPPEDPVTAWLTETFPHQHVLRAEIAAGLRHCPALLLDPPNKAFFGNIVEFAIGLALSDQTPYLRLLSCLDRQHAERLLTLAGYAPTSQPAASHETWHRTDPAPHPARIFTAASRLAHVHCLRNDLDTRRPDVDDITRMLLQRHPDLLHSRPDETFQTQRWFRVVWSSYTTGFHGILQSYGRPTAQLSLLDGHRHADFLLGTTMLEVKSGRLDEDRYLDNLIRQVLTYALLAHQDGHPVTHIGVYAARYQRLLRYPIKELADRLADTHIDLATAAARTRLPDPRPTPTTSGRLTVIAADS